MAKHQLLVYTSDGKVSEIFADDEKDAKTKMMDSRTEGILVKAGDKQILLSPHNIVKVVYTKL